MFVQSTNTNIRNIRKLSTHTEYHNQCVEYHHQCTWNMINWWYSWNIVIIMFSHIVLIVHPVCPARLVSHNVLLALTRLCKQDRPILYSCCYLLCSSCYTASLTAEKRDVLGCTSERNIKNEIFCSGRDFAPLLILSIQYISPFALLLLSQDHIPCSAHFSQCKTGLICYALLWHWWHAKIISLPSSDYQYQHNCLPVALPRTLPTGTSTNMLPVPVLKCGNLRSPSHHLPSNSSSQKWEAPCWHKLCK